MTEYDKKISGVAAPLNPVQQPTPSEGRRRLVKSAIFAVPAIITLNSNSALAAQESVWCVVTKFAQSEVKDQDGNPVFDDQGNLTYETDFTSPDPNDSCFMSLGHDAPLR